MGQRCGVPLRFYLNSIITPNERQVSLGRADVDAQLAKNFFAALRERFWAIGYVRQKVVHRLATAFTKKTKML